MSKSTIELIIGSIFLLVGCLFLFYPNSRMVTGSYFVGFSVLFMISFLIEDKKHF
jgi:hypothetical protein